MLLENIQKLCKQRGIKISHLEKELGFGRGSIYKWDTNSPSIDKVQKVANYLYVSVNHILYGYDMAELANLVNYVRGDRTIEQFSQDTGVDADELSKICLGIITERPSIDAIRKIASVNKGSYVTTDALLEAAGYVSEAEGLPPWVKVVDELTEKFNDAGYVIRTDIDKGNRIIFIEDNNENVIQGMHLYEFIENGEEIFNNLIGNNSDYYDDIETIAAHHEGDEWTEEELKLIEDFKQFVRSQRKK